ncbi:hypothetical protein [Pseudolysinimonas yzui]|uniref:Uncharacterized protein n=1 Tax=Pseudolysinimonas yzui TaxID=2708254 RepID=A0A8J3GMR2_9MICO|nr:hypothetical protein [Pseudolysinimonas yzui]GHF04663.1 hypothetical protein GCM10011600_01400 [Pseudolysinimonas yzui]
MVSNFEWLLTQHRYVPRVLHGACRMTDLVREERVPLVEDLTAVGGAVNDFVTARQWAEFPLHEIIPAWGEQANPHSLDEIVHINKSGLAASDAVIVNDYMDGSLSLGWLVHEALESCRRIPVLVLARDTTTMSKALRGRRDRYAQLTIRDYRAPEDAMLIAKDWLSDVETSIDEGAQSRQEIDAVWAPTAKLVEKAITAADGSAWRRLEPLIPYSHAELLERAELVTPFADISSTVLVTITSTLGINLSWNATGRAALDTLSQAELKAWKIWSRSKNSTFARLILESAIADLRSPVIKRKSVGLGQPGGWDVFAQKWADGALG